jgi:exodeoxyribonuclease-3
MPLRLLTYNIRYAGTGREDALAAVIASCSPDIVLLQEAERPDIVRRLAAATGLTTCGARPGKSLAYLSRVPIAHHAWHRARFVRRAYLELVPEGMSLRIFGVHLSAIHSNVTEWRRAYELRSLLKGIARHQHGFHIVAGDFNTLAPGERLDVRRLPPRLRAIVWMTGRTIRYVTIGMMHGAGYKDAYRLVHPDDPGYTFPTWDPHVRLDYLFVPAAFADLVTRCEVVSAAPRAREASDHFPLTGEIAI